MTYMNIESVGRGYKIITIPLKYPQYFPKFGNQ